MKKCLGSARKLSWIAGGLMAVSAAGCGEALVDGKYAGEPQFTIRGHVENPLSLDLGAEPLTVFIAWETEEFGQPHLVPLDITATSFPASFELAVMDPLPDTVRVSGGAASGRIGALKKSEVARYLAGEEDAITVIGYSDSTIVSIVDRDQLTAGFTSALDSGLDPIDQLIVERDMDMLNHGDTLIQQNPFAVADCRNALTDQICFEPAFAEGDAQMDQCYEDLDVCIGSCDEVKGNECEGDCFDVEETCAEVADEAYDEAWECLDSAPVVAQEQACGPDVVYVGLDQPVTIRITQQ